MNKRILLWVAIVLGLGIIGVLAALFLPGLKPSEAEVGIEDISDLPDARTGAAGVRTDATRE